MKWAKVCGSRRTRNNLPFCALSRVKLSTQLYSKPLFKCAHRSRQRNFPLFVSRRFLSFDLNLMASKVVWMCDTCAAVYLSNNQVTCIHITHTRTGETKLKKNQITLALVDDIGGGSGGWCRPMTVLFPRSCIALPGRSIEFWRKNNKLFVPARAFAFPVHIGWFESNRIVHLRTWIYAQILYMNIATNVERDLLHVLHYPHFSLFLPLGFEKKDKNLLQWALSTSNHDRENTKTSLSFFFSTGRHKLLIKNSNCFHNLSVNYLKGREREDPGKLFFNDGPLNLQ